MGRPNGIDTSWEAGRIADAITRPCNGLASRKTRGTEQLDGPEQVDIHSGAGFGLMIDRADNDCAEYRESFARQVCRRARKDGGPNGRLPVPGNIIVPPVRVLFNVPLADLHTVLPGSVK